MKPNPRSQHSLRTFFKTYEGLTNCQLATIAGVSTWTIVRWKRKCGVIKSNYKKPPSPLKPKGITAENWDNKEWFEKAYQKMGLLSIALLLGKKGNWHFVARKLKKYGIPLRSHKERVASKNPCCDEGWLHYYYADRDDYLKWCNDLGIEPCPKGGQRLTTIACAELANVSDYTIANWLSLYKMRIRDLSEASRKSRTPSLKERRMHRDKFFENYRNGNIYLIIGANRYSNGRRMDRTEIISKKFNAKIRGTSPRPKNQKKS